MKKYPISIPVNSYEGKDQKKRVKNLAKISLANEIADYLNKVMEKETQNTVSLTYLEIAKHINSNSNSVKEILFEYNGGSTGITITKA